MRHSTAEQLRMEHSGQTQIVNECRSAADFRRDVDAVKRRANQPVVCRVGKFRAAVCPDLQQLVFDQRSVPEAPSVIRHDRAIVRFEALPGDSQPACRGADQQQARLCGGMANRSATVLHRMAARGVPLVGASVRCRR